MLAITPLSTLIEDVRSSVGYRYGAKDSQGHSMDTLKIIEDIPGSYIGVYHTLIGSSFNCMVSMSTDLINWLYYAIIDNDGSQPYITKLPNNIGFIVALEAQGHAPTTINHLKLKYYTSLTNLLSGISAKTIELPITMPSAGSEGTPNIYSIQFQNPSNPDIYHSTMDIGFHFLAVANGNVDRQARGTLTNFNPNQWSTQQETMVDTAIRNLGAQGNVGDRDYIIYDNTGYNIIEGQLNQTDYWGSWKCFLWNWSTLSAIQLDIVTHNNSQSLANPSYTLITAPNGDPGIVICIFIFSQNSGAGESGELIYYKNISIPGCNFINSFYTN